MKKLLLITRTLLVAVCLLLGGVNSAWATTETVSWTDMATSNHDANKAGAATSANLTPANGVVTSLNTNSTVTKDFGSGSTTYYRYSGFAVDESTDKYFEYSFSVASGYTFTPSKISVGWAPNGGKAVQFNVYAGTSATNLVKIGNLVHSADNTYSVDDITIFTALGANTNFTIIRLVPFGKASSIILNSVSIEGSLVENAGPCTVTFDAGSNGICETTSLTEASGGAGVTLPAVTANSGYEFNGWYTAATEGTKAGNAGETYKPSVDITLYAQYTAQVAASITTQPSDVSVPQGKTATLSVVADGTPVPTYQWYSCSDANKTDAAAIDGATSASYKPSTTTIGTYYYYVVVSNGVGEAVTSNVVTLTLTESITIGLEQAVNSTDKTVAAATYTGIANITVAEAHGDGCGIGQTGRTPYYNGTQYTAAEAFRKTVTSSTWDATEWIGYTVTLAADHKMTLTNLKATMWDCSNTNFTWRVVVEDKAGTALYTSSNKTTSQNSSGSLTVESPSGLSDLLPGTYTVKLQMYQNGGNKYFAVPYLTFDATVTEYVAQKHTVTTSVNNAEYGTVTATAEYSEGTNVAITATPNTGYKFVSWTVDGTENASTENPYTFASIADAHTIQAVFAAMYSVTFSKGDDAAVQGTAPADVYADGEYTLPAAQLMYKPGYTLTAWNDGTADYAVGSKMTVNANVTLTPVYTQNAADLWTAGTTVTWDFRRANSAPNIQIEGNSGALVSRTTIGTTPYDAVMNIDATNGKFNNVGNENDVTGYAQINTNTKLTIPALSGMAITFKCNQQPNAVGNVTFDGNDASAFDTSAKTLTYTYTGDASTLDIVVVEGALYPEYVTVAYPSPYTVTYDGNGATSGSTTDAVTYDKDASVTAQDNGFTKTGYAFTGWNTEADGTGTAVAAGATFSITDNTTLYAQWIVGTAATITYNLTTNSSSTDLDDCTSATPTSGDIVASTTINTYGTADCDGTASAKTDETQKLKIDDEYTAANYYEWTFTIGSNANFTPTQVVMKFQAVSGLTQYKVELTDGTTSHTADFEQTTSAGGTLETMTWNIEPGTAFAAGTTGRLKLWAYKKESKATAFRLGSPITITGVVAEIAEDVSTKSERYYASYVTTNKLDFSAAEGITAYIATGLNGAGDAVVLQPVRVVPAGEPIIVKTDAKGATVNVPVTTANADDVSENKLVAGDGKTAWNGTDGYIYYYLASDLFHQAVDGTLQSGKAYLKVEGSVTAPSLGIVFDLGGTTSISATLNKERVNSEIYNLAGQRVAQPTKGLYIVNGKKVVIK